MTATLARLEKLYSKQPFDPCRFRPKLVIEPASSEIAFVEEEWVRTILALGEKVRPSINTVCLRCVVTTLAQFDLLVDLDIIRMTAYYNNIVLGSRAAVL